MAWFAMTIQASNQIYVNTWMETFDLNFRVFASKKDLADRFVIQALERLNLACLKHRKAAKCWAIRFKILNRLSVLATKAHLDSECAFYEKETPPSQKEMKRTSILLTTLAQEYKVCDKINVHHPRNYYLWYYR